MKATRSMFVRGTILLAMALTPTLQVVGQGPPGVSGTPGAPGTYPYAPAYYDEPFVGYQSQSALQTGSQRDAAATVLENNIGYSLRAPFGPRLGFDGIFGDRRGIEGNDYSVFGFLPWHVDPGRNVVFANLRGTATDLGDFVGNFGVGQRMFFEDINRIFGWSAWYDLDDSHNQTYHRAGGQLEYFGRYLEIRGGADIILDTNQQVLRSGFTDTAPFFRGNNAVFTFSSTVESAYDQAYAEAGGPMPFLGRYGVNAYGGAYYLWNDNADDSLGWTVRAAADITRDVQVGVRHTNDDIFGHNTSVNVTLSFPNGGLKQVIRSPRTIVRGQTPNLNRTNQVLKLRPSSVASLMGSNVVRDFRTPVDIETSFSGINAIDPVTGVDVCIIHVDPNAATAGTGTFEDPFRTLEAARLDNDGSCRIIRVVPRGDGSGTNLAVADTFGLFTNQRLLGSSFRHEFETTRGIFELPGFTGSGAGPLVTHSGGGDVIRMGNNTEISGVRINGSATGNGVIGSPVGFDINRTEITNSLNGTMLTNATGLGLVTNNVVSGNINHGIGIANPGGGTLDLRMSGNTTSDNGADGSNISVTGGTLVGSITDHTATGNTGNGFAINADASTVDYRDSTLGRTIEGNVFSGNMGDGFHVNATNDSTVAMRFRDNDFGAITAGVAGNMGSGLQYVSDSGWHTIDVGGPLASNGNRFIANLDTAAQFDLTGTADMTLLFQNNTIGLLSAVFDGDLIRAGFDANSLAANDDGSTGLVPIGFNANFFGTMFTDLFVNNNGNVTFNSALGTFTPFPIVSNGTPIIAPFFADVDTRAGNIVTYGQGTVGGQAAFGVNYIDVRHFAASGATGGLPTNSFQLVLIDRSDIGAGDFDIEFNYDRIVWEAGTASGSDAAGLGGSSARAGFSNGTTNSFELAGSGVNGAFLDSGPAATSLVNNSLNSSVLGRYVFEARNGGVNVAPVPVGAGVDGLQVNTDGMANIKSAVIDSNQIQGITGAAVNVQAGTGSTVNDLQINNNNIVGVGSNGIRLAADNLATINLISMVNNTSMGNGLTGFTADATNNGFINIANVQGNNFSSNGTDGAYVRADGGSVVSGAIGVNGGDINTLNANGGFGVNFEATDGGSILGPGGAGNFAVVNNMIGDTNLGNGLGGINAMANATAPTLSTLNLAVGGTTVGDANTIVNNTDVGIGYSLQGNSTGELLIMNNTISDTLDDDMMMTTPFDGQGVYVEVAGTSTLTNSVIDANMITDNASQGVQGLVREMGMVTDMIIGNLDGDDDDGNVITGNMGDGIRWQRRDSGQVTNMRIVDNTLMSNANGLNLISQNTSSLDTYIVNDNTITMNNDNGVRLRVEADADLDVDMDNNLISMNTNDGIEASESTNTPTDSRSLRGTWTNNEITMNGGFGVELSASTQDLMIGTAGNGNLISNNQLTGIRITGPGSADINSNMITMNNLSNAANDPLMSVGGIDFEGATFNNLTIRNNIINNNIGTGVRLANVSNGPFAVDITLTNNTIDLNTGDGLEITANNDSNVMTITSSLNRIRQNMGRGVDILNQGDSDSVMSFTNETVTSNELEGFYVVNSASTNQNQSDAAADGTLLADGAVDATPTLNLTLTNSVVSFNGNSSSFDGTGFVLRVGTSDGGSSDFNDPGGFASDGRGGVIANVSNNMFAGNFGDDVIFESFVSTVNPATTGGTWTDQNTAARNNANDVFAPTGYESDPLARLDLTFVGNTGDSADVTRFGAFYNNDEAVFKSRTIAQDNATDGGALDDPGPFDLGTRSRNAQRLASRDAPFDDPSLTIIDGGLNSDDFLYPGVGESTFRRTAASNTAGFGTADLFTGGVMLGTNTGELDFIWGTFVP